MAAYLKIYFKNGIDGTPEDWTPYLSSIGKIKPKVESDKAGEAGVIMFDKVDAILEYKSGTPVYTAFNTDLTSIQRYIIDIYGLKTDKSEHERFIGLINFQSLDWPDGEKKISFEVLDKLSALSILQAVAARESRSLKTQNPPWLTPLNYAAGEYYQINIGNTPEVNIEVIKYTGSPLTPHHVDVGSTVPVFDAGEILRTSDGTNEKLLFATGRYFYPGNYLEENDTWLEAASDSDNLIGGYRIDSSDGDAYLISNPSVKLRYYKDEFYGGEITNQISAYYDGILKQRVTSLSAQKIIKLIYNQAWPGEAVINRSSDYSIANEYWRQTIDENPFGMHPLDALKMLADSMQSYIFIDRFGELVIQNKSDLGTNGTTRTLSSSLLKKNGNKKYMWDKLVDEVQISVKSWVKNPDTGEYLVGYFSLKKNVNIKSRNPFKKEILATSSETNTQTLLDAYAASIATDYFYFYGWRHWAYNISLKMNNSMFDWELLDNITIDGIQYFFISFSIDLMTRTLDAELVSVEHYDYDFSQAHIVLNDSNESKYFSSSSPSGGGAGVSVFAMPPLSMAGSIINLNYEDNLKLSDNDKLDTIQDIKTTSTTFQVARAGFGGAPDTTYKVKNYGDEWVVGNVKIDGVAAIAGAIDTNFKLKIYGNQKVTGNLTVDGDLYIAGSINEVNVNDLNIIDHAIRLNKGGDDTTALDGGIEMLGASDSLIGSIKFEGTKWLSDLDFDIASGKVYKINNTQVLSATALGTAVLASSLTSVGTLTTGVWHATAIADDYITSAATWNAKEAPLTFSYPLSRTSNIISLNYNATNLKLTSNALNTIQDIATTSSPTFVDTTLSGVLIQQGTDSSYFGSQNVLPSAKYYTNLGSLSYKYLTLHAAELWVETLVAQNTIATIGGRIVVGPTTTLVQDLAAGATTMYVKHNEMAAGDTCYLEANGSVEFIYITGGPYGSAGNYYYSVTRDRDGSGSNNWAAGDAVFNTGTTGDGFIDVYSVQGIKSSGQVGPTIVGNIRNSTTYNDWNESWAIGNLNGLYGYSSNTFGVGLGKYASNITNITIDSTNGYRIRNYATTFAQWDNTGKIILGQVANSNSRIELSSGAINFIYRNASAADSTLISLDASGNASFTGSITAASGTIGGWTIASSSIHDTTNYITIDSANKTIKIIAGDDPLYQMNIGQTAGGVTFAYTGYYGISAVNSDGDYIFRLDNAAQQISGWTIGTASISKTYASGSYSTITSLSSNNATAGLDITTQYSSTTKLIVHAGGYNDGGATRYGFCIWDNVNSKFLLNIGFGGTGNNMVTKLSGLQIDGDISSSKFSTVNSFDVSSYINGVTIQNSNVRLSSTTGTSGIDLDIRALELDPASLILKRNTIPGSIVYSILSIKGESSDFIQLYGKNVPKYWGVTDTAPTTGLNSGDYYHGTNGALNVYNGSAWKTYNVN